MNLHIAGTGCPDPGPDRYGTCFVLEVGGQFLMFDCGPAATYKLARMGLRPTQIDRLFITHHHFDHNADLPCFLLTRWDQGAGRCSVLHVYGPPPTEEIAERLIGENGAFIDDIKARIGHPASHACHVNRKGTLPRPGPNFEIADTQPGLVEQTDTWRVTAASVEHVKPWLQSLIYRVDSDEGSVVFTGDAGPCPAIAELSRGADTLVICAAFDGKIAPAIAACVTSASDAARIGKECGVKTLILTHTTPGIARPGRREACIGRVAREYDGRVIFADELTSLKIP